MALASRQNDRGEVTMFRLLGFLFLLLALIVLGGDIYFSLQEDGVIRPMALGEWWAWLHRDSLLLLQPAVERHISPKIWDPGIQTMLELPAVVDFAALGIFFWLLGTLLRRRRRRRAMRLHR